MYPRFSLELSFNVKNWFVC